MFVAILLPAALALVPMVFLGNASGHDLEFHADSWVDVAQQWHEGVLYPRWAAWANFDFGEPRFIFYPPVSWLAGASLGGVLPWILVPGALTWLTSVLAAASLFVLAREWLTPADAGLAAAFFALNPYNLMIIYYRSDFSELIALAVLPLLVLGMMRISSGDDKGAILAALSFAGIWLSNAPVAVEASYVAALLLIVGWCVRRSMQPLLQGGLALIGGLGLAAFYILPAAFEQRWVNIGGALTSPLEPEHNFLFSYANDPDYVWFNWKTSMIGLALIGATFVAAVIAARAFHTGPGNGFSDTREASGRRRVSLRLTWPMLLALAVVATTMMFPLSRAAWEYLPKLRFVQFPWRWLGVLAIPCSLFLATAARGTKRRQVAAWGAVWMAVALIGGAIVSDSWWDSDSISSALEAVYSNYGYDGTDEYAPRASNHQQLPEDSSAVTVLESDGTELGPEDNVRTDIQAWAPERKLVRIQSPVAASVALKLLYYPAWKVKLSGRVVSPVPAPTTGQILVPISPGVSEIEVSLERPWDRTAGLWISAASLLLLLAVLCRRWQRAERRHAQN